MAATQGTMTFIGRSGKTYIKDVYLSDTVNTPINFDGGIGASATSPLEVTFPEEVILKDVALVTGAAQTKLQLARGGVPTGDMLRHTLHLNTLAFRPALRIGVRAGVRLTAIQLA